MRVGLLKASEGEMGKDNQKMKELRTELSNLRDDLAVIESSFFMMGSSANQEPVYAIRRRISELESILEPNSGRATN